MELHPYLIFDLPEINQLQWSGVFKITMVKKPHKPKYSWRLVSSTSIEVGIPTQYLLRTGGSSTTIGSAKWDEIVASDFLKLAALFGVFVYSEESHHTYHNFVTEVISRGSAIYVFADSTLNYGNSFPFNNGIITNLNAI